jgi:hypothetical protein
MVQTVSMNNTATTTNPARCSTGAPVFVRADALTLGTRILVANWDGVTEIWTVTCLELVGDDVIVNNTLTTSVGNVFQAV